MSEEVVTPRRSKLNINWSLSDRPDFIEQARQRYQLHLRDIGLRDSTIEAHLSRIRVYLRFAGTDRPTRDDFKKFREAILEKKLARNTINNYCQAISHFHQLIGNPIEFTYLKPNDQIPHYFDAEDIQKIFNSCFNIKHLAMIQTLFFAA